MTESRVDELLDALTPSYADRTGDWERVVADAASPRRVQIVRVAAGLAAAAAVAAFALVWPFGAEPPGLLERARAAIGDGPVLHVVLRGEWGGTLVDLQTGKRSPVYGEDEIWYDRDAGRVHTVTRLGGVVQHDAVYEPKEPPRELAALGREYKRALESGTARVTGEDTIGGDHVVWVTIHSELLPDVADNKDHEFAQQVAISKRTFKPVALRTTRDGEAGPGTFERVIDLELLPTGQGDLSGSTRGLDGTAMKMGREPIAFEDVRGTLGHTPLWLGREYDGLPFAQAYKETTARGERREVQVTGPAAQAALECAKKREQAGACLRGLGLGSVSIRAGGVFRAEGPIVWSDEQTNLVLFYGTVGDDPSTFREDLVPLYDRPHVTLTETTKASPLRRIVGSYTPPAGSVFVAAGGRMGVVRVGDVVVTIEAVDEDAILAAARALEPLASTQ